MSKKNLVIFLSTLAKYVLCTVNTDQSTPKGRSSLKNRLQHNTRHISLLNDDCDCGITKISTSCSDGKNIKINNRIVNKDNVKEGEIPWQAKITAYHSFEISWTCGGVLINKEFVLTVAHCVLSPVDFYEVMLGTLTHSQSFWALKVFHHPSFDNKTGRNEIALLKIDGEITFTEYIKPVCLPKDDNNTFAGYLGVVSGYGENTKVLKKYVAVALNKTDKLCKFLYNETTVPEELLCVYNSTSIIEKGDSGGPFATLLNNKCTVIGISVMFVNSSVKIYPAYVLRVSKYLDWIVKTARGGGCLEYLNGLA